MPETPQNNLQQPPGKPNLDPMIPIGKVLQANPLLPPQPSAEQEQATYKRLQNFSDSSGSKYSKAVLMGFGTALVLIVVTLVFMLIKTLS